MNKPTKGQMAALLAAATAAGATGRLTAPSADSLSAASDEAIVAEMIGRAEDVQFRDTVAALTAAREQTRAAVAERVAREIRIEAKRVELDLGGQAHDRMIRALPETELLGAPTCECLRCRVQSVAAFDAPTSRYLRRCLRCDRVWTMTGGSGGVWMRDEYFPPYVEAMVQP